jgi:hypothetical protein
VNGDVEAEGDEQAVELPGIGRHVSWYSHTSRGMPFSSKHRQRGKAADVGWQGIWGPMHGIPVSSTGRVPPKQRSEWTEPCRGRQSTISNVLIPVATISPPW